MPLSSVEVIPYALPFREPYVTARGTLTQREMVLLRLRDEDGFEGLGEAVPLSLRGGVTVADVVRELEGTPLSIADALAGRSAIERGVLRGVGDGLSLPASCALFTALLDLAEKRDGTDADNEPVRCNATLIFGPPAAVAEEALRWAADGFGTFKLKLGAGEDVAQVEAVRAALGPEAKIRLDANAAWSLEEATAILGTVEPLGIELVEQPVATIEEAARLAAKTSIPLAGDESIVTVADAEAAVAAGAFATTGIKLSKVGGIEAGAAIEAVLPAYVASALDGPVGIAAGSRLAARIDARHADSPHARPDVVDRPPILAHGLATQRLFAATIGAVECELRGDLLHPPRGPGLGVVIDEEALEVHRL
jgi:o-succinylbenzoate synthase